MYLLHNIGTLDHSNYNTVGEVVAASAQLSFDGVYTNVYDNRHLLKDGVILFVMGAYIGQNNSFDHGAPRLETYCTIEQLKELESMGCILGWHSWTHCDLRKCTDEQLKREVTPMKGFGKYFAYPHGLFDNRVIEAVKAAGYEAAFSVTDGDDSQFQKLRRYL